MVKGKGVMGQGIGKQAWQYRYQWQVLKAFSMVYWDSSVSEQGQKFSASDENISVRMF
jgi:hypothetical protein